MFVHRAIANALLFFYRIPVELNRASSPQLKLLIYTWSRLRVKVDDSKSRVQTARGSIWISERHWRSNSSVYMISVRDPLGKASPLRWHLGVTDDVGCACIPGSDCTPRNLSLSRVATLYTSHFYTFIREKSRGTCSVLRGFGDRVSRGPFSQKSLTHTRVFYGRISPNGYFCYPSTTRTRSDRVVRGLIAGHIGLGSFFPPKQ